MRRNDMVSFLTANAVAKRLTASQGIDKLASLLAG